MSEQVASVILDEQKFLEWLRAQPDSREVNLHSTHNCVICQFVRHTIGQAPSAWWDEVTWFEPGKGNITLPLPVWFTKVIGEKRTPLYYATFAMVKKLFGISATQGGEVSS